jgi:hypothetical protein
MNGCKHILVLLFAAACVTGGCGEDLSSTSSMAASLLIPRDLVDDLASITIYVIETDQETHQPDCATLLGDLEAYKNAKVVKRKPVVFDPQGTSVLISGIPDRGRVWRFYARGFNSSDALIAHGCVDGVRDVPAKDTIEVTIEIQRVN